MPDPEYPSVPVAAPEDAKVATSPTPMPPDMVPLQTIPKATAPPEPPPDGKVLYPATPPLANPTPPTGPQAPVPPTAPIIPSRSR
jgi:fibronectin-binding protein A